MSSRAEDLAHPTQPSSSVANAPNSPYSRVYNAATNAAQPLLGYLAGAAGVAMAAAGDPGALSAVTSGVNVDAAQADRPVTRTASVPSSSSVPGAQSLGTADEETRRKDIRNLDNIVAQFYAKATQIITQARFTHLQAGEAHSKPSESSVSRGGSTLSSRSNASSSKRSRNRWFNIEMEETDTFREELRTWRSVSTLLGGQDGPSSDASVVQSSSAIDPGSSAEREGAVPTLVIEVLLDLSDMSPNQVLVLNNPEGKRVRVDLHRRNSRTSTVLEDGDSRPNTCTIVLERWALSLKPSIPAILPELPTVYKHCIILFRALYTLVRALPSFEFHRKQKRRTGRSELKIGCRLSTIDHTVASSTDSSSRTSDSKISANNTRELGIEEALGKSDQSFSIQDFAFMPVITPIGSLNLKCTYRSCVDFSVEEVEALLSSRFIDEDFFKPTMRKYSTSTGATGSLPSRSRTDSSTSVKPILHTGTAAASRDERQEEEDGAFVIKQRPETSVLTRIASHSPKSVPSADLSRRPSVGTSHPFKASSSAVRPLSTTPPDGLQGLVGRLSSSPGSSNFPSAHHASLHVPMSRQLSSPGPGPSVQSASGSMVQRYSTSPMQSSPPISALTALRNTTSPFERNSPNPIHHASGTQPIAMATAYSSTPPGSSSPSPSLLRRYSSARYSRSLGQGSLSSSPNDYSWGHDSSSRRSRLSSMHRPDDITSPSSLRSDSHTSVQPSTADADAIRDFLGMLDSRPDLTMSRAGSTQFGVTRGGSPARGTMFSRVQAEEKLRHLAESVYKDSGSSETSVSTSATHSVSNRHTSFAQHVRTRSGEYQIGSLPLTSRHTPSPDLYAASSADGTIPQIQAGVVPTLRQRASQAPMSGSIPEEESHSLIPRTSSSGRQMAQPSATPGPASLESQFPFPRYVPASMRRRGSSQSSVHRPSLLGLHGQSASPTMAHGGGSSAISSSPEVSREPTPAQSRSFPATSASEREAIETQGSIEGADSQHYESAEEQAMAQLDLSNEEVSVAAPAPTLHPSHHGHYRWDR